LNKIRNTKVVLKQPFITVIKTQTSRTGRSNFKEILSMSLSKYALPYNESGLS